MTRDLLIQGSSYMRCHLYKGLATNVKRPAILKIPIDLDLTVNGGASSIYSFWVPQILLPPTAATNTLVGLKLKVMAR